VGILPAIGYMSVIGHLPEEQAIGNSQPFAADSITNHNQWRTTMPTAQTSTGKTATRRTKNDAIKLLTADHAKVKKMFKEFEKLSKKDDEEGKQELATQICQELTVHAQLEEEIFYPAAREAIEDEELMNEAVVEHNSAKELIAQIQSMGASDPMFDATVKVLGEYVNHHIEEEQNEIFPKVEKAKVDLEEIGAEIAQRKEELMEE
jgi:hemerythrin superfamily protein